MVFKMSINEDIDALSRVIGWLERNNVPYEYKDGVYKIKGYADITTINEAKYFLEGLRAYHDFTEYSRTPK